MTLQSPLNYHRPEVPWHWRPPCQGYCRPAWGALAPSACRVPRPPRWCRWTGCARGRRWATPHCSQTDSPSRGYAPEETPYKQYTDVYKHVPVMKTAVFQWKLPTEKQAVIFEDDRQYEFAWTCNKNTMFCEIGQAPSSPKFSNSSTSSSTQIL